MAPRKLIQNRLPMFGIAPADYRGLAPSTPYVSMKGYDSLMFIIQTGASDGFPAVIVNEATDVAGTGAQQLTFLEYWTNEANIASANMTRTVCASTFAMNAANALYVVEIIADTLTTNSGYDCISMQIGPSGKFGLFFSVAIVGNQVRYQLDTASMIDAMID